MRLSIAFILIICCWKPAVSTKPAHRSFNFGLSTSHGVHIELFSTDADRYQLNGLHQYALCAMIKSKQSVVGFEPSVGLSFVNYRYELGQKGQHLILHFVYLHSSVNVIIGGDKSHFKPLAGLYLQNYVYSSAVVRESNPSAGGIAIQYGQALDQLVETEKTNKTIAGINAGCAFRSKKWKNLMLQLIASQDVTPLYRKNALFPYTTDNRNKKYLQLNAQPASLALKIMVTFG